ncbi:hypothetical protein ANO14919_128220 [Xylariales sp. No.14919]|nr:hypothetical protein ANO14919_128220 [Xylariales sp. No.14919]
MDDIGDIFGTLDVRTRPGRQKGTDDPGEGSLSPWGQRYGVLQEINPILKEGEVQHSGFITGHPRLDPKFFGDVIPPQELNTCGYFRHPNDIARFFYIEAHLHYYWSFRPWWQAALSQYVLFSPRGLIPGGNRKAEYKSYGEASPEKVVSSVDALVSDEGIIQVDENTWFPFFQRHRWYDSGSNTFQPGETVILDDPKLWKPLSLAIELANRILIALINDQHPGLHTLLFGKLAYWKDLAPMQPCPEPYPLAKVLLSYEKYKSFCDANNQPCPLDEPSANTPADWSRTLVEFCSDLKWGVVPLRIMAQTFTKHSVIVLRSEQLELLSGSDVTLAEQCYITLNIAEEIIHELSHAISHSRIAVEFPPTSTRGYQYDEPFIDFGPLAEMGFDITQRIFGGIGLNVGHSGTKSYPIGAYLTTWPPRTTSDGMSNWGYKIRNHPSLAEGKTREIFMQPLPALHSAKMLSKYFWEDPAILRKSDNFFHRNVLFSSNTFYRIGDRSFYEPVRVSTLSDVVLAPGERELVESWQIWSSVWESTRSGVSHHR